MKDSYYVRCLEKPFGINVSQQYEKGDPVIYHEVYKMDITPYQTQVNEEGKKTGHFFWTYTEPSAYEHYEHYEHWKFLYFNNINYNNINYF